MPTRESAPFIERMAPTNHALLLWIALAIALVFALVPLGWYPKLAPYHFEIVLPSIASFLASLALASWSIGSREREEIRAIKRFWSPFANRCCLVLPSSEPAGTRDGGVIERSPFAPYHDIVAATEVHAFLARHFGAPPDIISSLEIPSLQEFGNRNLILIGGPNFNTATRDFMHKVRQVLGSNCFQWSSEFKSDQTLGKILVRSEDHLVRIDEDTQTLIEEVFDVRQKNAAAPTIARGLCFRGEDLLKEGWCVLVLAGVDSAHGTLASARFIQNPKNLVQVDPKGVLQLVVHTRPNGYEIGRVRSDRELNFSGLNSEG